MTHSKLFCFRTKVLRVRRRASLRLTADDAHTPMLALVGAPGNPTLVHAEHRINALYFAIAKQRWACVELILEVQDTEKFNLGLTLQDTKTGST